MKKHIILISIGILNVLHGLFHIIQFIQSAFFVAYATHNHHHHHESWIEKVMHNPIFALLMGLIGVFTLVIGIKDFRHHQKCNSKNNVQKNDLNLEEQLENHLKIVKRLQKQIGEKNPIEKNEFIYWN
jgi:NADH:ubiquinone oxidoreductase subunit 5 (subunit L)/multisubunit Na+/H+ antiporter MnhA subunit